MFLTLFHVVLHLFSGTVATIGVSTVCAMILAFAIAGWQRRHSLEQGDSKDYRETAYQTLSHAVDRFTRQEDSESPMRMRGDWATVAHALETSDILARSIKLKNQKRIWTIQVEYFRRVMLSELKTEEAFLQAIKDNETRISAFHHRPASRHVVPVIRWVFKLSKHAVKKDLLSEQEFETLKNQGLTSLADQIYQWQNASFA